MNTYAFLHPGSSATFCTYHVKNVSGVKTSILLHTLGQERTFDMFLLHDLEISS